MPARRGDRADRHAATGSSPTSSPGSTTPTVLVVNKVDAAGTRRRSPSTSPEASDARRLRRVRAAVGAHRRRRRRAGRRARGAVCPRARTTTRRAWSPTSPRRSSRPSCSASSCSRVARDELPHSITVTVEEIEPERRRRGPRDGAAGRAPSDEHPAVRAVIRVERDSQKGIVIGKGGAVLKEAGTPRPAGARGAARGPRVPGDPGPGRARLAAPRPVARPPRVCDSRKPWSRGWPVCSGAEAPAICVPTVWPGERAGPRRSEAGAYEAPDDDAPRAVGSALALVVGSHASCLACVLRTPRTTARTRCGPRAPRPRRSTTSSRRSSGSRSPSASSSSPRRHVRRLPLPPPRGQEREPEADPRQHAARDRLDDRPGADPRGHRRPDGQHDLRPRRDAGRGTRSRSRSSASSGGGSSTTPTQKVVTADEMHIPTGRDVPPPQGVRRLAHRRVQRDPQLLGAGARGQADVVPGHDNRMKIRADKPGTYLGQCAEYCGLSHANMRFRVIAETPDDYDAVGRPSSSRAGRRAHESDGSTPRDRHRSCSSKKFQCTNCHMTDDSSDATTARTSPTSRAAPRSRAGTTS